jgi:HrpA-like RNA helicase
MYLPLHLRCISPQVLAAISSSQVVVIEGETGCGKSTQVPQYVLEQAAADGTPCSIIVTQPRRISALGVSERVAAERGESVGGVVGYSIRLESKASAQVRSARCT